MTALEERSVVLTDGTHEADVWVPWVANLVLTRALARGPELALRRALGAGRTRLASGSGRVS